VRAGQPYWQKYWYDVRFRREGTPSFEPMGPGGPRQVPNKWLATGPVDEFVDWFLAECVDDLSDLRGELRVLAYTEATPGPDTEPVLVRAWRATQSTSSVPGSLSGWAHDLDTVGAGCGRASGGTRGRSGDDRGDLTLSSPEVGDGRVPVSRGLALPAGACRPEWITYFIQNRRVSAPAEASFSSWRRVLLCLLTARMSSSDPAGASSGFDVRSAGNLPVFVVQQHLCASSCQPKLSLQPKIARLLCGERAPPAGQRRYVEANGLFPLESLMDGGHDMTTAGYTQTVPGTGQQQQGMPGLGQQPYGGYGGEQAGFGGAGGQQFGGMLPFLAQQQPQFQGQQGQQGPQGQQQQQVGQAIQQLQQVHQAHQQQILQLIQQHNAQQLQVLQQLHQQIVAQVQQVVQQLQQVSQAHQSQILQQIQQLHSQQLQLVLQWVQQIAQQQPAQMRTPTGQLAGAMG
jgi:hypothetical protein